MIIETDFATRLRERREALARYHTRMIDAEYDRLVADIKERGNKLRVAGKTADAYRMTALVRIIRNVQKERK